MKLCKKALAYKEYKPVLIQEYKNAENGTKRYFRKMDKCF